MFEDVDPGRRRNMAAIKGKDTRPEMLVRRRLHALGYRFFVNRKGLPGRPDLVFPGRRKVVLVHGCFWHFHSGCGTARVPATRADYWSTKLSRNRERDAENEAALRADGWDVAVVWECELARAPDASLRRLRSFLGSPGRRADALTGSARPQGAL